MLSLKLPIDFPLNQRVSNKNKRNLMSIILRLHKVCNECGLIWYPKDEAVSSSCPNCGSENTTNEKFNFIATVLFYLVGVIVLGLVIFSLNQSEPPPAVEPLSDVADSLTKAEQQINLPEVEEESESPAQPPRVAPTVIPATPEKPAPAIEQAEVVQPPQSVAEVPTPPKTEPAPVEDLRPLRNVSTTQITFSLWSVSELRLRRAYTNLLNNGSASAEANKKEYLHFVSSRAKKCGELNPEFEKNINSIEKIKFKDGDSKVLECYASENTSEYNRLNIAIEEY
jgi:predicted  nucleic acid-binding Zn-ribbon protein